MDDQDFDLQDVIGPLCYGVLLKGSRNTTIQCNLGYPDTPELKQCASTHAQRMGSVGIWALTGGARSISRFD